MTHALTAGAPVLHGALPPFELHAAAWACVLASATAYAALIRVPRSSVTQRQAWSFLGALGLVLVATTWPLAGMAAHTLLLALVVQRMLFVLGVPALLVSGMPSESVVLATRPAPADFCARVASRPVPATAIVSLVTIGSFVVPAVQAQASSVLARAATDLALVIGGIVLWSPVLHPFPGAGRVSGRRAAVYLGVQSLVLGLPPLVWVFAAQPLYPAYVQRARWLSLSPLADQGISGLVASLATITVLWTVALVVTVRSRRSERATGDPELLTWADVEREFERITRHKRRGTR